MWSELAVFWYILKYGTSDRWGSWGGGGGDARRSAAGAAGDGHGIPATALGGASFCIVGAGLGGGGGGRLGCLQRAVFYGVWMKNKVRVHYDLK